MRKPDWVIYGFRFVLGAILFIWVLILFSSCSVERQAQRKTAWLIAHDKLDDVCARIYPVRDSLIIRDSIRTDTVTAEPVIIIDSVQCNKTDSVVYVKVKCPPAKTITQVIRRDSIIYQRSTAEEDRLKGEIIRVQTQLAQKDQIIINQQQKIDKNDWWKTACLVTWGVVLLGFVFRFFVFKKPL